MIFVIMKILKRLSKGGLYSNKIMAKELGIDESMVEQMISQLERLGYIKRDNMNASSGCDCGCCDSKKKKSCCSGKDNISIDLWKLTEKGKAVV